MRTKDDSEEWELGMDNKWRSLSNGYQMGSGKAGLADAIPAQGS